MAKKLDPIHPGEILLLEFLEPLELSQYRLAKDISVPPAADQRDRSRQAWHLPRTQLYALLGTSGPPRHSG